jgi:hypothetical protein
MTSASSPDRGERNGYAQESPISEMPMTEQLTEQIRENASGPRRASGDSGSVDQHSLTQQIAADRYLASKDAAKRKGMGIRVGKMIPPGAC